MYYLNEEYFLKEAFKEADKSYEKGEIPIGAIITESGRIISRAHNLVETLNDCTAHAEMIALTSAFAYCNSKYLPECTIYITLEPCPMCAFAIRLSQIRKVIFATEDKQRGYTTYNENIILPKTQIIKGIMKNKGEKLLKEFFKELRN